MTPIISIVDELEQLWRERLPLAGAMDLRVREFDVGSLMLEAPLDPNINPHGTAFAGSLYSIAALTGWSAVWLTLKHHDLDGDIVLSRAEIDYRRPVAEDIVCRCEIDACGADWRARYAESGRCDCALDCTIVTGGKTAVAFAGTYRVKAGG